MALLAWAVIFVTQRDDPEPAAVATESEPLKAAAPQHKAEPSHIRRVQVPLVEGGEITADPADFAEVFVLDERGNPLADGYAFEGARGSLLRGGDALAGPTGSRGSLRIPASKSPGKVLTLAARGFASQRVAWPEAGTSLTVWLLRMHTCEVRVVDPGGIPVPGVLVGMSRWNLPPSLREWEGGLPVADSDVAAYVGSTGENGVCQLGGLAAGQFNLAVESEHHVKVRGPSRVEVPTDRIELVVAAPRAAVLRFVGERALAMAGRIHGSVRLGTVPHFLLPLRERVRSRWPGPEYWTAVELNQGDEPASLEWAVWTASGRLVLGRHELSQTIAQLEPVDIDLSKISSDQSFAVGEFTLSLYGRGGEAFEPDKAPHWIARSAQFAARVPIKIGRPTTLPEGEYFVECEERSLQRFLRKIRVHVRAGEHVVESRTLADVPVRYSWLVTLPHGQQCRGTVVEITANGKPIVLGLLGMSGSLWGVPGEVLSVSIRAPGYSFWGEWLLGEERTKTFALEGRR